MRNTQSLSSKPCRIAFGPEVFFDQRIGGISRYITRLALELSRKGEEVQIFAPPHLNVHLAELPDHLSSWSVFGRALAKLHVYDPCYNSPPIRRIISRWKPQVIHETYYHNTPTPCNGIIPRILTVYDMIHELLPEMVSPGDPTAFNKRASAERAEHIICISENTRQDLIRILDVSPSRISVIHLGADVFDVVPSSPSINVPRPFILYVGQRGGYKNFQCLLTAYASSKNLHNDFDIVAFGGGSFTADEQEAISRLRPGSVRQDSGDDSRLSRYYEQASVFVYPSLYEGFGLPPLEAMARRCPVASSSTSSMPEVIGDAGEFFDPHDPDSLLRAVEKIVGDDDHADDLRARGEARVQLFTWENCAEKTLEIYKNVIN